MAIGVPEEDDNTWGSIPDAGAVHVLYGTAGGLAVAGNQFWHQNSPGIEETPEHSDYFGEHLAAGDFNSDGFADLAITVRRESIGALFEAGAVHVLYGAPAGLSTAASQFWHQDSPGIEDEAEGGDWFGSALAAGDFNLDGFSDLAVGVSEGFPDEPAAGAVNILYGSTTGLSAAGNQFWHQNSPGIEDDAEIIDFFGSALGTSDFNGDGFADLAVGAPGEDLTTSGKLVYNSGAMHVLYGSATGLSVVGSQFWHLSSPGLKGDGSQRDDVFGRTLAAGDFNGDGFGDLAAAATDEDIRGVWQAGAVHVLHGSAIGLTTRDSQLWHQDRPGVTDVPEPGDRFGWALTAGDFNGDGFTDLAAGVPWENPGGIFAAGAVHVLNGSAKGLSAAGAQFWHQDGPGIRGEAEQGDTFGWALTTGDFNSDGVADLGVGVPGEDVGGAVSVLYGSRAGLSGVGDQLWHQDSRGIEDRSEPGDGFGSALSRS